MKHLCVLIYETLMDLEKIFSKEFYKALKTLKINQQSIMNFNARKKVISEMKKTYHEDLKKVRNIIGAHRDHDFLTQMQIFKSLDRSAILKIMTEFDSNLNSLAEALQVIFTEGSNNFIKP